MEKSKNQPMKYYKNRLTPPKSFFEWCYQNMRTYVWENKQQKLVASSRKHKEVIKKRLTVKSKLSFFDSYEYFDIVLSTTKRVERQTYKVYSFIEDGRQHFKTVLINLHLFTENNYITIRHEQKNEYVYGKAPILCGMWLYEPMLFPNYWRERLSRVSELKYLNLESLSLDRLQRYYKYRVQLEYIQKIKACGLEKEFNAGTIDFRRLTAKKLKDWKSFFKNSERRMSDLDLKISIEKKGGKFICGSEKFLHYRDIKNLDSSVPIVKLQNYLIKQEKMFRYYSDYFAIVKELGYPINKKTLFPKDLRLAHDNAVDTLNKIKIETRNKNFEMRYPKLKKLEMNIKGICFVVPKTAKELVEEGQNLNHCVGSMNYIEKHAKEQTTIIFVRKASEPEKSYYTIELSKEKIIQFYGYRNCDPEKELKVIANEWQAIIKKLNKMEKNVA